MYYLFATRWLLFYKWITANILLYYYKIRGGQLSDVGWPRWHLEHDVASRLDESKSRESIQLLLNNYSLFAYSIRFTSWCYSFGCPKDTGDSQHVFVSCLLSKVFHYRSVQVGMFIFTCYVVYRLHWTRMLRQSAFLFIVQSCNSMIWELKFHNREITYSDLWSE